MPENHSLILAADCVRKDPNISGLIRLGDAVGAERVYFIRFKPGQFHAANEAHKWVPWSHAPDGAFLEELKMQKYAVVGVENLPDARPYYALNYPPRIVLVFGSESNGIRPNIAKACDYFVRIPQLGQKRSLNVVGAAHVVAYEVLRQWEVQAGSGFPV